MTRNSSELHYCNNKSEWGKKHWLLDNLTSISTTKTQALEALLLKYLFAIHAVIHSDYNYLLLYVANVYGNFTGSPISKSSVRIFIDAKNIGKRTTEESRKVDFFFFPH